MGVKKPPGGGLWRVELGGGVSARLRKSGEGLCKVKLSDAGVKNLPANIEQQNGAVSLAFFCETLQHVSHRVEIHQGFPLRLLNLSQSLLRPPHLLAPPPFGNCYAKDGGKSRKTSLPCHSCVPIRDSPDSGHLVPIWESASPDSGKC